LSDNSFSETIFLPVGFLVLKAQNLLITKLIGIVTTRFISGAIYFEIWNPLTHITSKTFPRNNPVKEYAT
jgi:hypothetical protein